MVHDGNGRIRLSGWNWLVVLAFTVGSTSALVASHFKLANDVHLEIATISTAVSSNAILIDVNRQAIRDNRADIKTLHLNN